MKSTPKVKAPIRVMIADDHPLIRTALKAAIQSEADLELVGEARNGAEALHLYQEARPQVVILDLNMPIMNGLEALRKIRQLDQAARVLILSNSDAETDLVEALATGALGYALKDTTTEQLLNAIRSVALGQEWVPGAMVDRLEKFETFPGLTRHEFRVLRLIKAGLSNEEIALRLHVSASTVKSHIKSVMTKLKAKDRTQAVAIALRLGLLRLDD